VFQVPGGHADQTRVGDGRAAAHVEQAQLVRRLDDALHRRVVQRRVALGVHGDRQLLEHTHIALAFVLALVPEDIDWLRAVVPDPPFFGGRYPQNATP